MNDIEMVLDLARSHIGYRETGDNGNIFAEDAETRKAYGGDINHLPWCDIFVDYLFCHTFGADAAKTMTFQRNGMSAACERSADCYKAAGAYDHIPAVGDQIFFYSGCEINHTGIVETVSKTQITTIEGNTSDSVARRTYWLNDSRIAGFGHPQWSAEEEQEPEEKQLLLAKLFGKKKEKNSEKVYRTLRMGSGMNAPMDSVKAVQALLNEQNLGIYIATDGEFGRDTETAVKAFQRKRGLESDGIVGVKTWTELIQFEVVR